MAYVPIVVTVDPAQITQEKIDAIQARIPGLEVREGHVLYWLFEVTSDRDAQNLQLLSDRLDDKWDSYGGDILRVARETATQATGLSTWTRVDTPDAPLSAPLTIPAGTQITLAATGGTRVAFETRTDVTFAAAAASTAVGEVEIIAIDPGEAANGLQGDPQSEQTFTWLDTIVVEAPTAGGADAEDTDTYRDRIADEASIMARTLVQADNFAVAARGVTGVDRALGIDNYDADTATADVPGHTTVAVIDTGGADPGATVRANVLTELESRAMINLAVHVIAPTYTTITVVFDGKSLPGYDPADVEARAEQAVLDFLDPARWGLPALGDQRLWVDSPVVYFQDIVTVINNVEGMDRIDPFTSLTVNGGTSDVTLTGPAALPAPSPTTTVNGTITAP